MKTMMLTLAVATLYSSSGFGWSLIRVEGILGVKNETTLHRVCTLSDEGIVIKKNVGSWETASRRNLTRHFVATAKRLSGEAHAVDAELDKLPAGTPVVNYWIHPDQGQGYIFRSEQFPVGAAQRQVKFDQRTNEVLADFLDVACNAD